MNAHHSFCSPIPRTSDVVQPNTGTSFAEALSRYRARDVGIGYGQSSGYALDKRYSSDWGQPRFRFR